MAFNEELYEQGMKIRRAVVGDAYVDASLKPARTVFEDMGI